MAKTEGIWVLLSVVAAAYLRWIYARKHASRYNGKLPATGLLIYGTFEVFGAVYSLKFILISVLIILDVSVFHQAHEAIGMDGAIYLLIGCGIIDYIILKRQLHEYARLGELPPDEDGGSPPNTVDGE